MELRINRVRINRSRPVKTKCFMDILSRDYKPEYERLKKERLAEVAAEQQKQLDRLKKDVAQGGDSFYSHQYGLYVHVYSPI